MARHGTHFHRVGLACPQSTVVVTIWFLFNGVAWAQDPARTAPSSAPATMPARVDLPPLRTAVPLLSAANAIDEVPPVKTAGEIGIATSFIHTLSQAPAGVRRITLD